MEAFGYIGPNGIWTAHPSNYAYITSQFDRKLEDFTQRGGDTTLARRVAEYVAKRGDLLRECTNPVLCHIDLHAGNLFAGMTSGAVRLCGVLDFEGALAGDPLKDVAKALYYLGDEAKNALLEGYGGMERAHWAQALRFYHLLFILELWCWMDLIGNKQPLDELALDLERYMIE
jgi:hygromycin-B 7''-O-kinase